MTKLNLTPDRDGYQFTPANQVISVQLAGGASRSRLDLLGSPHRVRVRWVLGPDEYVYIMAFYRSATGYGSLPFTVDLILEDATYREYTVKLVPGTFGLTSQSGLAYTVEAELEVMPQMTDIEYDEAIVMLIGEYGEGALGILEELEFLVNECLP